MEQLGACADRLSFFRAEFPDGGEYQEILDRFCEKGNTGFAMWLLSRVGKTDDVREYKERVVEASLDIVFAGRVVFKASASIRRLVAGCDIKAGWGIKAGADFGIFAGLRVKITRWNVDAKVSAKQKPVGLISGHWVEEGSR